MDAFEEAENKKHLDKTKEEYKKRLLKINRIITIIFGSLGLIFLIVGITLLFITQLLEAYLALLIVGGVYLLVAIVLNIVLRNIDVDKIFDKYQSRIQNYKTINNTGEMSVRVLMLESRVKKLEEEIESLKKNIR